MEKWWYPVDKPITTRKTPTFPVQTSKILLSISVSSEILSDPNPYDNSDSVVDSDEIQPKKSDSKTIYYLIITLAILVGLTSIYVLYGEEIADHPNVLLAKDTIKSISKEANEPTKDEVIQKLKACTVLFITIQSLIDQMEPEDSGYKLDSISEEKQKVYNESYISYFDLYCNKINDEILQTDSFQNFNKTRSQ